MRDMSPLRLEEPALMKNFNDDHLKLDSRAVDNVEYGDVETTLEVEFWCPLVFHQAWPCDIFTSRTLIRAGEGDIWVNGTYVPAGESYLVKVERPCYCVVEYYSDKPPCTPVYRWGNDDFGDVDDCNLYYPLPSTNILGKEYLIPLGGKVGVMATEDDTTITYFDGSGEHAIVLDRAESFTFEGLDGSWVLANKPVAVAVGHVGDRRDTWAYLPLPVKLLDERYMFTSGEASPTELYLFVMAKYDGTTITVGSETRTLAAYEVWKIASPSPGTWVESDKPIAAVVINKVAQISFASFLLPHSLWGKSFLLSMEPSGPFVRKYFRITCDQRVTVQINNETYELDSGTHLVEVTAAPQKIVATAPIAIYYIRIGKAWGPELCPYSCCTCFPVDLVYSGFVDYTAPRIGTPFMEPSEPVEGEPVTVSVSISDPESGVDHATLYYRLGGAVSWTPLAMMYEAGLWKATIPGQPAGTTVEFYIEAYDKAGNRAQTLVYTYTVKAKPTPTEEKPPSDQTIMWVVVAVVAVGLGASIGGAAVATFLLGRKKP